MYWTKKLAIYSHYIKLYLSLWCDLAGAIESSYRFGGADGVAILKAVLSF